MKVLQLGPYPPPHGGVQSNLVAIREGLRREGHSAPVINITRHRKPEADEVYYPESAAQLIALLFKLDYDIVHLHLGGDLTNRLLALCTACCSVPGKKTVLTFHSGGYPGSPAGQTAGPRTLRGMVLRRFDRLIGVNQPIVDLFHKFGVPPAKTRFIYPHALPAVTPAALPESLESFFARHSPVFSTVGLLEPEYDFPLQIRAMQKVLQAHPQAGLVIIGAGSLEAELRILIGQQAYRDHILLYGDLAHASTLQVIARSTIFLRTTLYDGDSVSVREAIHLGTPVIGSDNGMRPPEVRLFPIGDDGALFTQIEKCLLDPPPRKQETKPDGTNVAAVLAVYRELQALG